ncbi:MAG: insulinase family protein, partial [Oceanobacter sp.]
FRRIYSGEKQAMNPDHPYSQFFVGSLETLSDTGTHKIRDDLITFYNRHYSSDRMTLVLAANYPLDTLEQWAESRFSAIPKRDPAPSPKFPPLFAEGSLPLDMQIEPVKEIRRLKFTFPMPEVMSQFAYKPVSFLSGLIGHEGEGSILALLKDKGWAENLSAGTGLSSEYESALSIQIGLTKAGREHIEEITQILDYYLSLLKNNPLPEYLLTEQHQLNEMEFRFQEQGDVGNYVVSLSSNLLKFPPQEVIHGPYLQEIIPAEVLQPYLKALDPKNMLRTLVAPDVVTDAKDPWYSTPIAIGPSTYDTATFESSDLSAEDKAALHLPASNPFIPEDFSLKAETDQNKPELLINEPGRMLWYYPEQEFKLPKAQIIVRLEQADMDTPARQVLARLFARSANEALNTYSYPAHLAGLDYGLSVESRGIRLMLSGYQDKLPELMERLLHTMKTVSISEAEFTRYQASLRRSLENQLKSKPYERGIAELKRWIYQPSYSEADLLAELDSVTPADVELFSRELAEHSAQIMYVHGSLSSEDARQLSGVLTKEFASRADDVNSLNILQLPSGQHQLDLALDHDDKGLVLYVQGKDTSDESRARFALLGQLLSSPYYEYMRTERQLGYIVFAAGYPQRAVPGLVFIVQSPSTTPAELLDHTQAFWQEFTATLADMGDEEFASYKSGLSSKLLEPPKNMSEKAQKYWYEIDTGRTTFDTNKAIAAIVETLTLDDIRSLYQAVLNQEYSELAMVQGGTLEGWTSVDAVEREQLP